MEKIIQNSLKNYPKLKILDYRQNKHHVYKVGIGDKVFVITISKTKKDSFHFLRAVEGDFRRSLRNLGFENLANNFRLVQKGLK